MIIYTVKVDTYGSKSWHLNGECHREDGPAIESANGSKFWCLHDQLHREDGPAIEHANGDRFWYLHDKELTETDFTQLNKITTIDGVQYKLTRI